MLLISAEPLPRTTPTFKLEVFSHNILILFIVTFSNFPLLQFTLTNPPMYLPFDSIFKVSIFTFLTFIFPLVHIPTFVLLDLILQFFIFKLTIYVVLLTV